ncbi:MAG TPA: dihydroorotase family protein [Ktedonobacteraceae bacterium]|nr:dihydroorotase family protein [Ktedonobacteraceae bacterium]
MATKIMGSLVLPERVVEGTLVIEEGRIAQIEEGFTAQAGEALDFRGKYLLPGLIEIHGHMREPGLEYKEDIPHGTRAGLAGGYTLILDMPNTRPPTTTPALLEEQIQRYTGRSYCDFAINMGVARDSIQELRDVDPAKITGVKIFAAGHGTALTTIPHLNELAQIFEILGQRGIMAIVHAENQELIDYFTGQYRAADKHYPAAWTEARNLSVILTSVLEMIALARHFGVKLHLLHLSTPEEFAAVEFGRSIGVDVTGETTTVHLSFTSADYEQYGNMINIAPALRSPADQEQLWQLLRAGKIDAVITDHAPHTLEEKRKESVWEVSSGMPGLQEAVPVLVSNWLKRFGRETLEEGLLRIAQVTSQNIARVFGFARKGGLLAGKDADLVVIDTEQPWRVTSADLFTKNQWSIYEGQALFGRPVATFLRGQLVYRDGQIVGEPQGRHVVR